MLTIQRQTTEVFRLRFCFLLKFIPAGNFKDYQGFLLIEKPSQVVLVAHGFKLRYCMNHLLDEHLLRLVANGHIVGLIDR